MRAELIATPVRVGVRIVAGREQDKRADRKIPVRVPSRPKRSDIGMGRLSVGKRLAIFKQTHKAAGHFGRRHEPAKSFFVPVMREINLALQGGEPGAVNKLALTQHASEGHTVNPLFNDGRFLLTEQWINPIVIEDDRAAGPHVLGKDGELLGAASVAIEEKQANRSAVDNSRTEDAAIGAPPCEHADVIGNAEALNVCAPVAQDIVGRQVKLVRVAPAAVDDRVSPASRMATGKRDGRTANIGAYLQDAAFPVTGERLQALQNGRFQHRDFANFRKVNHAKRS